MAGQSRGQVMDKIRNHKHSGQKSFPKEWTKYSKNGLRHKKEQLI